MCLTVPKVSVDLGGESFTVAIISSKEKVSIRGGVGSMKIFRQKRLPHSAIIFRTGTIQCFTISGY